MFKFKTKGRLRTKAERYQVGNKNSEDVPREAQDERGTKENKKSEAKGGKWNKKIKSILPIIRRRKAKKYLCRSLRIRFQKHNIVVRFASGNGSSKTM